MTVPPRGRLAFVLLVGSAALFASCVTSNRHREISAAEFLELANMPIGSAFDTRFIGATGGRVYLSVWSALPSSLNGGEDVCSCLIADLPAEIGATIRAGGNPWPK